MLYPAPIAKLIDSYSKLPELGSKQRLVWLFTPLVCQMMMLMNLPKLTQCQA